MAQEASKQTVEPRARSVQDNLARMHRYFDLLYSKDMDAMLELIDDDIEWLMGTVQDAVVAGSQGRAWNS